MPPMPPKWMMEWSTPFAVVCMLASSVHMGIQLFKGQPVFTAPGWPIICAVLYVLFSKQLDRLEARRHDIHERYNALLAEQNERLARMQSPLP